MKIYVIKISEFNIDEEFYEERNVAIYRNKENAERKLKELENKLENDDDYIIKKYFIREFETRD